MSHGYFINISDQINLLKVCHSSASSSSQTSSVRSVYIKITKYSGIISAKLNNIMEIIQQCNEKAAHIK